MPMHVVLRGAITVLALTGAAHLVIADDKMAARAEACAKRNTVAAQHVCLDRDLTRSDALLGDLYQELSAKLKPSDAKGLADDQRAWKKERDACGAKTDCLADSYTDRIAELEQMLESMAFPNKSHVEIGCGEGQRFVDGECLQNAARGQGQQASARLSCDQFGKIKSEKSKTPITVEFVNNSDGYRTVMWIGFDGLPVQYADLNQGASVKQTTYLRHPWMFTDGPGNCIEMFMPQDGITRFEITVPSPAFGPEDD